MRIQRAGLRAFRLPLRQPIETAHGPISQRQGFLVTLEDASGHRAQGEATPLAEFGTETLAECEAALRRGLAQLCSAEAQDAVPGRDAGGLTERGAGPGRSASDFDFDSLCGLLAPAWAGAPCARMALETALAELSAAERGEGLAHWIRRRAGLTGPPLGQLRVQALVAGATPAAVTESARAARAAGFDTFKLKLAASNGASDRAGQPTGDRGREIDPDDRPENVRGIAPDRAQDIARVAALRAAVGVSGRIRLDANEAWDESEARRALQELRPFAIEFIEQPLPRAAREALAALERATGIAIAADEALLGDGLEACLERAAASVFVVKPAAIGGLQRAIELARAAPAKRIRLVWSNLIEGLVGRSAALALAAAFSTAQEVHGLGTAGWLARDLDGRGPEGEPGGRGIPAWLSLEESAARVRALDACWQQQGEIWGDGATFGVAP